MKRFFPITLLVMAFALICGCAQEPAAVVGGQEIPENIVQWNLNQGLSQHRSTGAEVNADAIRSRVLNRIISDKLMYLGALDKGITVTDDELKAQLNRIAEGMGEDNFRKSLREASLSKAELTTMVRERMMADKFANTFVEEDAVTEEDIKSYYQDSPTPFLMPARVNVRFIEAGTKELAEGYVESLNKGKDFDELADEISKKGEAAVSSYSWANPSFFSPEMSEALKEIEPGKYGGPFESGKGYFIFRVKEFEVERAKTLEEASDDIKALLMDKKKRASVAHWLMEKGQSTEIKITER